MRTEPFAVQLAEANAAGAHAVMTTILDFSSVGALVAMGVAGVVAASTMSVGSAAVFLGLGATATISFPVLLG